MITYDKTEAANFLKMGESTLDELLKTGEIIAAKHGQRWCFLEDDLVAYYRKQAIIQMDAMRASGKVLTTFAQVKVKRSSTRRDKPVLSDLNDYRTTTSHQPNQKHAS